MEICLKFIHDFWPHFLTGATILAMVSTAVHVIMKKRDSKAAIGWLGLVWFAPALGVCLYWLFGINRIQRHARKKYERRKASNLHRQDPVVSPGQVGDLFGGENSGMPALSRLTERVSMRPLLGGNRIDPLINGDEAYPAMLSAIAEARVSISLSTYIFANDSWGAKFRIALRDAKRRRVEVRVLIDAVGARYSFPSIISCIEGDGILVSRFMKTLLPWRFRYLNLRNHRKIMVTDGRIGFTGGMNISSGSFLEDKPDFPLQDTHFKIQGPVVAELQQVFTEDWFFSTGEKLGGHTWFPLLDPLGEVIARGISDGPDADFDKLRFVMMGAITTARTSIRVATPYFVPDNDLITALQVAAMRGIQVQIFLPAITNLHMVKWASDALLKELVRSGCMIFLTAPPLDHSKLMVVDGEWVLIGSANWDARSLSLNFEFNVECYNRDLAGVVEDILNIKIRNSTKLTLKQLESTIIVRLRNRFFRLFSPYL